MVAIMYLYFLRPSRKGPRKFLIWREIEQEFLREQTSLEIDAIQIQRHTVAF